MATKRRKSSIKLDKYQPKKGDILRDLNEGLSYEIMVVNTWTCGKTNETFLYGVAVAYRDDGRPDVIVWDGRFLHELLGGEADDFDAGFGTQEIVRKDRVYSWDPDSQAYVSEPD